MLKVGPSLPQVEHGCQKELETLSSTLLFLAGQLPAPIVAQLSEWGEDACESVQDMTLGGAARGLLQVRSRWLSACIAVRNWSLYVCGVWGWVGLFGAG